jgi:hypothetical protein
MIATRISNFSEGAKSVGNLQGWWRKGSLMTCTSALFKESSSAKV